MPGKTEIMRQCAVTRRRAPADELIRFVLDHDGWVVPDLKARLPGRGTWVTASRDIVELACKKGIFSRSFKASVRIKDHLAENVDDLLLRSALQAFALANKAGNICSGFSKVNAALEKGKVLALIHASDAAEDGCEKLDRKLRANDKSGQGKRESIRIFGSRELSLALGRANVIHAAVERGGAGTNFLNAASRLERYRAKVLTDKAA